MKAHNALRPLIRRHLPLEQQQTQVFGERPKMHMADHMVHEKIQLYGSPRHFWCYGDEDVVGLVRGICVQTRHSRTMEARIIAKCCLYEDLHAYASRVM